jgi:hypothetical protein
MEGQKNEEYEYDVAFSYASENREYVEKVANILKSKGVKVFYDPFAEVDLWGKNLFTHFDYVYNKSSRYFIPFISKYYKEKAWANHELRSAFQRVLNQNESYMLPARFDDTEVEGINSNISYINLRTKSEEEFSNVILQKLEKKTVVEDKSTNNKNSKRKAHIEGDSKKILAGKESPTPPKQNEIPLQNDPIQPIEITRLIEQLTPLAQRFISYTNRAEKKKAFENILQEIRDRIPDIIDNNSPAIETCIGFNLHSFMTRNYSHGEGVGDMIRFVDSRIKDIQLFENDNEEQRREREFKSNQLRNQTFSQEKAVKIIRHMGVRNYDEKITEPDLDWPYSKYGSYTEYLSFKSHPYFPICLKIKMSGCADFEAVNHLVLLYIAVMNELNNINEELRILGR